MPDQAAASTRAPRRWLAVLVLLLAALGVRLGALALGRDAVAWNDQVTYLQRAEDLLDGKGYTGSYQSWARHKGEHQLETLPRYLGAYQAPGYPLFLAGAMKLCGRDVFWAKLAQVLLGAATTWFVYAIGRDALSHGAGLAAGWLYALDPTFVAFTHLVFNETVFVFLFVAGLWLWMRPGARGLGSAALAGVVFAAAAYVKSSLLYLLPLLVVWRLWRERASWRAAAKHALVAALAWSACIAPWTVRNYEVHGGFVLMDSSGPFNLWRGNQPNAYQRRRRDADANTRFAPPFAAYVHSPVAEVGGGALTDVARRLFATDTPSDLECMQAATHQALEYSLEDLRWTAERTVYKVVDTWNPTSFVMRHLERDGYGPTPAWVRATLSWACVLSYLLVVVLAIPELWRQRRTALGGMVLLLVYYYTAIHALTFGMTRFRLPVMPFLMLLAGATLARVCVRLWSSRWASARVGGSVRA